MRPIPKNHIFLPPATIGDIQSLEGAWAPSTIIIVEFPSLEQARSWYASPDYASAMEVRDKALTRNLILVDDIGVAT